ncbi:MAG: BT_3928 family protein [Bacteroidota bacterium]
MKIIRNISRILLGLVFIFSGFVKGVDPLGFTYKIIDYLEAFHMEWLEPAALSLAVLAIALEFVIGFALVLNARIKLAAWGNLLFMVFFTILTFYLALTNPVTDCGCFGDAIIMTNWETFFKNLILLALSIIVFSSRHKFKPPWKPWVQNILVITGFLILFGISFYSYHHLPILDFRAWKKGADMAGEVPPPTVYLIYENKETGEQKAWLTEDLPYDEPGFMEKWEFVDQRVIEPDVPETTLRVENEEGVNVSEQIFDVKGYNFILIAHDLQKADQESMIDMDDFYDNCLKDDIAFSALTGSLYTKSDQYKQENNLDYPFYLADDIALKTVIRSNPGLLLLKDGVIIEKWHHNDFPEYRQFKTEYMK